MKKEIIAACKTFGTQIYTISQIAGITGIARPKVRYILRNLETKKVIIRFAEKTQHSSKKGRPWKEITYRNTKNLGIVERHTAENGWDVMWKAVRILRRFTRSDLAAICGQAITNVIAFTKRYCKSGHIRPNKKDGREVLWILIKDPGPKRPI